MLFAEVLKTANVDDLLTNIAATAPAGGALVLVQLLLLRRRKKKRRKRLRMLIWKVFFEVITIIESIEYTASPSYHIESILLR